MLKGDIQELLERLALIKKRFSGIMLAVKIAVRDPGDALSNKIRDAGFPVFLTQWWFMFRGDTYGYAVNIPTVCTASQPARQRDPDSLICKASRDKIFVDQNMNLKACYIARKGVANLHDSKLGECMHNDALWGAWRTIRLKDMEKCRECINQNSCHICPASLIETGEHTTCMSERLE
jgi:MoaA/NifB/PqqE/SkfB family radical SAM enzyme